MDTTDIQIQHPKKHDAEPSPPNRCEIHEIRSKNKSIKKQKHTVKVQTIVCQESKIICSCHYDKVFKDSAYNGFIKIMNFLRKKSNHNSLTKDGKEVNKRMSTKRIDVEYVFGQLKCFKILSHKYRNRRKRM